MDFLQVKTIDMGFGELVELDYLVKTLKITRRAAALYLKALRIKPLYIGKDTYFSLVTFKRILFVLSLPGADGFLFPSSKGKGNATQRGNKEGLLTEVTDEILERAADPRTLAHMMAVEGRNPDITKKFITGPVGRPTTKEKP